MPLVRRRVLLKRTGNSYSCSGNCSSNYCASYCSELDGCYNCSNKCTSNCLEDCVDTCSPNCTQICKDAICTQLVEPCATDCYPVACHNCAKADTCGSNVICSTDQPLCKKDICGCDCVSNCPSKFQTDDVTPCLSVES